MGFGKKIIAAAASILAFLISDGSFIMNSQVRRVIGPDHVHGIVTESLLEGQVSFLADSLCSGRGTGTMGNTEASFWISRQFASIGLIPFGGSYSDSFRASDGSVGRNIAGLFHTAGNPAVARRYIVVAAHYDGYGELEGRTYPGADSNASGVVAMINAARMLKAMSDLGKVYGQDVIFVALDAKNINMDGVKDFWGKIASGMLVDPSSGRRIRKEDISVMVNIDQIGSTLAPLRSGEDSYLIFLAGQKADAHRHMLQAVNAEHSLGLSLGFDYYGSKAFTELFYREVSEQKVFLENGVSAVMFTSGITMNNNKTRDTADTLDYPVLRKRIYAIFHWIEGLM